MKKGTINFVILLTCGVLAVSAVMAEAKTDLWRQGISLIPYPQQVELGGADFLFSGAVNIVLDSNAPTADNFAAGELAGTLK